MEKQNRLSIRIFSLLIAVSMISFSVFADAQSAANDNYGSINVRLGSFKNAKGQMVDVVYKPTPVNKLKVYRPSQLISEGAILRNQIRQQCTKTGSAVVDFALKKYPLESTSFNLAMGLAAGEQMKEDPAYARHFVENSYMDPMAHLSFMGFMLGNRAAATLLSMTGLSYDPCRILKRNPMAPVEAFEQKAFQKYIHFIEGPLGLMAGMTLSDLGHEFATDKNVRLCARYQIGAVQGKTARAQAVQACDDAYTSWVLEGGDKLKDMIPSMINMSAVVTTLTAANMANGKLLKPAISAIKNKAGSLAMKAVDEVTIRFTVAQSARYWIWEGMDVVVTWGSKIPTPLTRLAATAGFLATNTVSTYAFVVLQDMYNPIIGTPISRLMQGSEIEKTVQQINEDLARTRANKWVFKAKEKPDYCDPKTLALAQQNMALSNPFGGAGLPVMPSECYETPNTPAESVAHLGKLQKKWRDFILADTMAAAGNWSDYVIHFANMYTDTRNFYKDIMKRIWTLRFRPNDQDELKHGLALGGVDIDLASWPSRKICDLPDENKLLFMLAVEEIQKHIDARKKNSHSIQLPTLRFKPTWGWDGKSFHPSLGTYGNDGQFKNPLSVDQQVPIADLEKLKTNLQYMICKPNGENIYPNINLERDLRKPVKQATAAEIEALRLRHYNDFLSQLYWNLNAYPHWSNMAAESDPNGEEYEEHAASNIYMRVNLILSSKVNGSIEPMAAGVGYIKSRRYDSTDIVQSMKDDHPKMLGRFDTAFMPEYLLASMVCGPFSGNSIVRSGSEVKTPWKTYNLGWSIDFVPPRVIPDIGVDICGNGATKTTSLKGVSFKPVVIGRSDFHLIGSELPHYDVHMSEWVIKGKKYKGMLEILKDFAHPSLVGDAKGSAFVDWWQKTFGNKAEAIFKKFREDFARDVLGKKLTPALQATGRSSKGLPLGILASISETMEQHLRLLDDVVRSRELKKEDAETYKKMVTAVRTHFKIASMMIQPGKGNLHPAIDAYAKAPDVEFEAKNWDQEEWSLMKAFPKNEIAAANAKITGPLDQKAGDAFKLNQIDLRHALLNLKDLAKKQAAGGEAEKTLSPLVDAIIGNLAAMVTDLDTYHGFLVSVRLEVAD